MEEKLPYEALIYLQCEEKPFVRTKHKCLRCRDCANIQFQWCKNNPKLRQKIDESLDYLNSLENTPDIKIKYKKIINPQFQKKPNKVMFSKEIEEIFEKASKKEI